MDPVKVTLHCLNKEKICTKLDGNPSMHKSVIERTWNVTDGRMDGRTDKSIPIIPSPPRGGGLKMEYKLNLTMFLSHFLYPITGHDI